MERREFVKTAVVAAVGAFGVEGMAMGQAVEKSAGRIVGAGLGQPGLDLALEAAP